MLREREEEKRRLQAEMRRREQELLAKIKEQQRELENMKQEKGKVKVGKICSKIISFHSFAPPFCNCS